MNGLMVARLQRDGAATTAVAAPTDRAAPVVLRWPSDPNRRRELADLGIPRLLLVDSDAPPPVCTDPLEDWIRLPSDERDIDARMNALRARAWPGGTGTPTGLRLQMTRLRRRIAELQLEIRSVRGKGYVLQNQPVIVEGP